MARQKGTAKTGGRRAGTPNKATANAKEWIQGLIEDNRVQLEKDLQALTPRERWSVVERLMAYTTPKMQSVEANVAFDHLSDEQLDALINELIKRTNGENND